MSNTKRSYTSSLILIGSLFFIFGFITWLNSVLIPFLKQACELSDFQAYFVTFAFYVSYFVMAIPSSYILRKTGFVKGMSWGLAVMAIGSLIFIPAAQNRMFILFLVGLFMQGTGLALLQTASNPYVTILGPHESAARRISIMGICNKIAGMIGIFILSRILFSDTKELSARIESLTGAAREAELDALASKVITPYIIMAVILFILAFLIGRSSLPEVEAEEEVGDERSSAAKTSILQFPHLMLGVAAIFFYVGVEVVAIDTLTQYGVFHGFTKLVASNFSIYALIALTVGYLVGIITIPKYISQQQALVISTLLGIILTFVALFTTGSTSIHAIIILSFAHAVMWPAIWPMALKGLGRFTKIGSALLIMGIVGGALLPLVYGSIAGSQNEQVAYWVLIPCYLFILYFALWGHKAGFKKS